MLHVVYIVVKALKHLGVSSDYDLHTQWVHVNIFLNFLRKICRGHKLYVGGGGVVITPYLGGRKLGGWGSSLWWTIHSLGPLIPGRCICRPRRSPADRCRSIPSRKIQEENSCLNLEDPLPWNICPHVGMSLRTNGRLKLCLPGMAY